MEPSPSSLYGVPKPDVARSPVVRPRSSVSRIEKLSKKPCKIPRLKSARRQPGKQRAEIIGRPAHRLRAERGTLI